MRDIFPRNQYKWTITTLTPYMDDSTRNIRYFRRVLYRVEWKREAGAVQRSGGTAVNNQIEINVPLVHNGGAKQYINAENWVLTPKLDLNNLWTFRVGGDLENTLILKGEYEAPTLEQWQNSEVMGRTLRDFRNEHIGLIRSPITVDEILYGGARRDSENMWRVSCQC